MSEISSAALEITSFRSVIALWPTRKTLADETGAGHERVRKWWQRDRIPSEWWSAVAALPKAREVGVTADLLADLSARRDRSEAA